MNFTTFSRISIGSALVREVLRTFTCTFGLRPCCSKCRFRSRVTRRLTSWRKWRWRGHSHVIALADSVNKMAAVLTSAGPWATRLFNASAIVVGANRSYWCGPRRITVHRSLWWIIWCPRNAWSECARWSHRPPRIYKRSSVKLYTSMAGDSCITMNTGLSYKCVVYRRLHGSDSIVNLIKR